MIAEILSLLIGIVIYCAPIADLRGVWRRLFCFIGQPVLPKKRFSTFHLNMSFQALNKISLLTVVCAGGSIMASSGVLAGTKTMKGKHPSLQILVCYCLLNVSLNAKLYFINKGKVNEFFIFLCPFTSHLFSPSAI